MSACTLAFLLVLCIAIASADNKGRGEWLCGEVTKYALQHPGKNVIAFAAGDYKLNGPATAVELTYEGDGCEHVTRLGSSVLGDSGKPIDAVVENFVPGAGKKMGDAALKWVLPCRKYKMVAFVDGTFTRYGDGGYENWCFTGGRCGPDRGICADDECCSKDDWCGPEYDRARHCKKENCQPLYGVCHL